MEKLQIKSNGQWELEPLKKMAWGDPDYEQVSHGNNPFKTKEAASEAKSKYISKIQNLDFAKTQIMPNIHSNKDELHVLLHRGMSGEEPLKPSRGPNMMDWSNEKTVKTSNNSIHTLHPGEAKGYAEDGSYGGHGKTVAFWVPMSSVYGHSTDVNRHVDPKGNYKDDDMHTIVAPGEYKIHEMSTWKDGNKV